MNLQFEYGVRHADVVQALRQAGCVILDDESWQPDDPSMDGAFAGSGMRVYYSTAYGSEQPKLPAEYFPDGQKPPAAWRIGEMHVQFRSWVDPRPEELQEIHGVLEAFQQLSLARFVLQREHDEIFAERTAQGLVLHPIWFTYALAVPDAQDEEKAPK